MTKNKKQKRSDKRNKQFKRSLGIAKSKAATHAKPAPVEDSADETLDMLKATHADVNPEPVADPEPVRIQASEPESKRSSTSDSKRLPATFLNSLSTMNLNEPESKRSSTNDSNVSPTKHSNDLATSHLNEPDLSALNLPDDEFMALLTQGTKMAGLAKSVQPPPSPFDPQPVYTTPTYQSALRQT